MVISPWVYHSGYVYWCMRVCVGSSIRDPAVRSHMFVQSVQGGCECCWTWYSLIRIWMAKWWRVVSLPILCQFLCIVAVNRLPMFEKGVTMGRILVSFCGLCWDNRYLRLWVKAFFMFLMMRFSGYARASRIRVRLLSSSCRMWSSEMIMYYWSA